MPEDLTDRLARFTPTGLDRDTVLFAAGRASARRGLWKWAAVVLALTNAVTLAVLLWPRASAEVPDRTPPPPPVTQPIWEPADEYPVPRTSYLNLTRSFDPNIPPPAAGLTDTRPPRTVRLRSFHDPLFN